MITMLDFLQSVQGGGVLLAGWLGCALLYLLGTRLAHRNRDKAGLLRVLAGLLLAELLCDRVWMWYFYPGGDYRNPGLVGMGMLLLWPALLALTAAAVTFGGFKAKSQ